VSDTDNLLKWTEFARTSDPEAVGHTLNELAGEIARLRKLCRQASDTIDQSVNSSRAILLLVSHDLANEGSKE
jgi:hypothetical protein